jgi:hypothetical protein
MRQNVSDDCATLEDCAIPRLGATELIHIDMKAHGLGIGANRETRTSDFAAPRKHSQN